MIVVQGQEVGRGIECGFVQHFCRRRRFRAPGRGDDLLRRRVTFRTEFREMHLMAKRSCGAKFGCSISQSHGAIEDTEKSFLSNYGMD
jgi:hypothetical protein